MAASFQYFELRGHPCRVERLGPEQWGTAEIYARGEGFVRGPLMEILFDGEPLDRREFDALVLNLIRPAKRPE